MRDAKERKILLNKILSSGIYVKNIINSSNDTLDYEPIILSKSVFLSLSRRGCRRKGKLSRGSNRRRERREKLMSVR